MFMSVVARFPGVETYPELAGARVLVTGLRSHLGVDLVRELAERKARLVVQAPERSPEMTEIAALLAANAAELHLFDGALGDTLSATTFAQNAARTLGGIDAVVNLIDVTAEECASAGDEASIETLVNSKLSCAAEITRIAANRMAVTWSEGMILNAVMMPLALSAHEAAVAGYMRTVLAAMTRIEAQRWSGEAIRINAIGPRATIVDTRGGACLTSEGDIAALALYLASRKGRQLTGHVFDAAGISTNGC